MTKDEMKDRISMALKDPILQQGFEIICKENAELKMQLEEWKKCFLSCSSPFCSKHFPTVESSGVLGNMEKKENLKRGIK